MRLLKAMLVVLLALGWAPLTVHCQLEAATGWEFLHCQPSDQAPAETDSHCDDACCAWESGHFHLPVSQFPIQPPVLAQAPPAPPPAQDICLPPQVHGRVTTAAPPDFPRPWHFFLRAALPVRAPSSAS